MIDFMTPEDISTELRETEKEEAAVLIPQIAVMTLCSLPDCLKFGMLKL